MTTATPAHVQRQQRFQVQESGDVKAVVVRKVGDSRIEIAVVVLDLSPSGTKLSLPSPLKFEEIVELRLTSDELEVDVCIPAEVRWVRPDKEQWTAGFAIKQKLPREILHKLAINGFLDRREFCRCGIEDHVQLQWQGDTGPIEVQVLNISEGGVSLLSSKPGQVGQRVLLTFENDDGNPVRVSAEARWQVECENGFQVGCQFLSDQGRSVCRKLSPAVKAAPKQARRRPFNRTVAVMLGIVAAAISVWSATWLF